MKLNEQELNYILSECLQNMLNEDITQSQIQNTQKNRTFNNNITAQTDADDDYYNPQLTSNPKTTSNRISKKGRLKRSGVGKALVAGFGITAIGALFGSSNIGNLLGTLSMFGGIAAALQIVGASHRRYDILNKMKIPRSADMAKQVASLAAAERISLQMECKNLQGNYKNAEKAYNKLAQACGVETVSWDELSKQIGSNFSITEKYLGGGVGEVNMNTDFDNQNVTESKIYEANFNAQDFNQEIQDVTDFEERFVDNWDNFDAKVGLETVAGIAALYKETYVLWYKWTRYIQVLIKYFPNDLKWDEIMKTAGAVKPESIWNTLYRTIFPKMSQITDAIGGKNSDGKSRKEIQQAISDEYSTTRILTVIDNNFRGIDNVYIIFDDGDGNKYALISNTLPGATIGDSYKITSFNTYISRKQITYNKTSIPVLKNSIDKEINASNNGITLIVIDNDYDYQINGKNYKYTILKDNNNKKLYAIWNKWLIDNNKSLSVGATKMIKNLQNYLTGKSIDDFNLGKISPLKETIIPYL